MDEFFDNTHSQKERCEGCECCKQVHANGGWRFFGCHHQPYHGKWVAEIKDCPKMKGGAE